MVLVNGKIVTVDAAMSRKVDNAPPLPEGYVMDAMAKAVVKKFGGEEMLEKVADGTARGEGLADQLPGEEKISDSVA